MRKYVILVMMSLFTLSVHGTEQARAAGHLVWFGLDYSHVKFIGTPEDFSDLPKIRDHYFGAWNQLILAESEKYDIRAAFGAGQVTYAIEKAVERSSNRDMGNIVQMGSYEMSKEQLAEALKSYISPSGEGTGAVFIMETLNKTRAEATMWVAVFDIRSGEMLHLKRYADKPGGFGFRNYWARPYYNVISTLKKNPPKVF